MNGFYGLLAEFADDKELLEAAHRTHGEGYRRLEAYSPFPVEGLAEAVGFRRNRVAPVVLLFGLAGGIGGYWLQYYSAVIDFPLNTGGRTLHSWPLFIPVTFELTVLSATLAAFFLGAIAMNGLPKLYHPIFNARDFDLASRNRFFLCVRSDDPGFDPVHTRAFLEGLRPVRVTEVPEE